MLAEVVSGITNSVPIIALVVTAASVGFGALTYWRNSKVQRAQFISNLTKDLLGASEIRRFFFKIDYEQFRFDPADIARFKGSDDERCLVALLYQYNMVGRLVRIGAISLEDVEFLLFEVVQVFKNAEIKKYLDWLDAEFHKHGHYGLSQRHRPVHDIRSVLDAIAAGRAA